MAQIYLAIKFGIKKPEWELIPYKFLKDALQTVKTGRIPTNQWKILRELEFEINEKEDK